VYYTVFRHKWLILASVFLGLLAAVVVHFFVPAPYVARAKLLVRYVLDTPPANPAGQSQMVSRPDWRGDNIMKTQVEILTSLNVAEKVAEKVGPEKVLAAYGGGDNRKAAAGVIKSGLAAEPLFRTDVIVVSFQHPDRTVVEEVLPQLLDVYVRSQEEIYLGSSATDQYYAEKLRQARERLEQTEKELKGKLSQVKILDLDEAKKAFSARITRLTDDLLDAESELAERRSVLNEATGPILASDESATNAAVPLSAELIEEYTSLKLQLDEAKRSERVLRAGYTDAHPILIAVRQKIKDLMDQKSLMETNHEGLCHLGATIVSQGTNSGAVSAVGKGEDSGRIKEITARVATLSVQLSNVQAEAYSVLELEPAILQLVRARDLELATYDYYRKLMAQRRTGDTESAGVVKGITPVQSPSPAYQDKSKTQKVMLAALGGCLGLGLAMAFLYDFVLDRTIRRSRDVRRFLRLPFFLSIPETTPSRRFVLRRRRKGRPEPASGQAEFGEKSKVNGVTPWDNDHQLRVFADGLRERLITHFEINHVSHSPKLVGLTGCNRGSGVSTLAAGLAAALSKIGGGNALLVDMNVESGEAHSFHSGKPGCALANISNQDSTADGSGSGSHYLAPSQSGVNDKLARVMPAGFTNLVTNLKASDYDYIVFDMPAITPISATPRLGSYMDLVLFVVESGKTTRQLGAQAGALLAEARANALVVLNKCRRYVPPMLSQDT
jgi:uncharacterized protein involved in exopolysaccharide biosynthesis/Mrp family chromosome partitioning ATPase